MHQAAPALAALLLLSGCADDPDAEVAAAAMAFGTALRSGDAASACEALAPLTRQELESSAKQPCPQALAAEDLLQPTSTRSLARFGREARVVVAGADGETDTWFLSRFDGRWLVVASGCRPRGGQLPYACDVEGA